MRDPIRMRIIVSLFAIIFSSQILAQNTISGKVSDISGKVITGASVIAVGGRGTQTNADGFYSLSLPNGSATIIVSVIGYANMSKTINVSGDMIVDFVLQEMVGELAEVILTTGARSAPRSSVNTPLPIDAFTSADLKTTAQTSFDKQLQYRVPSFNSVNTPVNDATTLLDPYEIRNLGPSRT